MVSTSDNQAIPKRMMYFGGGLVRIKFEAVFKINSNITDDYEPGEVSGAKIRFERGGPTGSIQRAFVTIERDSDIGDIIEDDDYKLNRQDLESENKLVLADAGRYLNAYLDYITGERLRDRDIISVEENGQSQVDRQVVGSKYTYTSLCFSDTLSFKESFSMTVSDANTGEALSVYRFPDTSGVNISGETVPPYYSWLRHARLASHPFDAYRNYYLIIEHFAPRQNAQNPHLTVLDTKLRQLGVTEIVGIPVDQNLLKRLYKQGRNSLSHAESDFKIPTNPDDIREIEALLPLARDLAVKLIEAKKSER